MANLCYIVKYILPVPYMICAYFGASAWFPQGFVEEKLIVYWFCLLI